MFRTSFAGDTESTFQVQGDEYDIYVKLADADRTDLESVSSLPIQTPKGIVRLEALATITMAEGPSKIYRYKRQRAVTVGANVSAGYDVGTIAEAIDQQINALSLPQGVTLEWGGDVEQMGESFGDTGVALVMAIALTICCSRSFWNRRSIDDDHVDCAPLDDWGVKLFGAHRKNPDLVSIMGVIMLVGIVVNNGLI